MRISEEKLLQDASAELKVLDGVINYADRMIYEESRRQEYGPLRRHAYGKTVVVETERQGTLTFRLSSTSATYPNSASGYATPHSPVGRLCAFLRPGDEDESPLWGEYRVREIRLFDRYGGADFEPNVRNFLSMKTEVEGGRAQISDLRGSSARALGKASQRVKSKHHLQPAAAQLLPDTPVSTEPTLVPAPPFVVNSLIVIEDDPVDLDFDVDDDEPETTETSATADEYYGLSESFFVNRTREQDQVMSRSPIGPMFVQGVAGSGKTSAALGRTKMLCDFNAMNVFEESDFRAIAGQTLAYWSGRYAGQFSQEGSVGFVRTGELIQYLKETCRRLDLPHLPVQEYPELRSRLRSHRRVERNLPGRPRWLGHSESRGSHVDTTMAWLHCADRAIGLYFSKALPIAIPNESSLTDSFLPHVKDRALRVARVAIKELEDQIRALAHELTSKPKRGFAMERLAARIYSCIEHVRKEVLSKEVIWVTIDQRSWISRSEQELAQILVDARVSLFVRNGKRLVFLSSTGAPVDDTLKFLNQQGERQEWSDTTRDALEAGQVVVQDPTGQTFSAQTSSASDLFLRLLPEAVEKLYVFNGKDLRSLSLQRGLGRERLELTPTATEGKSDELAFEYEGDDADHVDSTQRRRSIDSLFQAAARRSLLQPLLFLAEAYAESLADESHTYPSPDLAKQISEQLQKRQLTDSDIDLLLCLAHVVGIGFKNAPQALSEPSFFQAVFIDEVQDFTEQQVYLMAQQARGEYRAVTVVGDTAQKLHNGLAIDIPACFPTETIPIVQLTENLRQLEAPGLAWFSACFRAELQDGLTGTHPTGALAERMSEHADRLRGPELVSIDSAEEAVEQIIEALSSVSPKHTVAVLLPDAEAAAKCFSACKDELSRRLIDAELSERVDLSRRHVRHYTTVANAKGLEFDVVVVPNLEEYDLDDSLQVNRLYVALTRARQKLVILSRVDRQTNAFDSVWVRYEDGLAEI